MRQVLSYSLSVSSSYSHSVNFSAEYARKVSTRRLAIIGPLDQAEKIEISVGARRFHCGSLLTLRALYAVEGGVVVPFEGAFNYGSSNFGFVSIHPLVIPEACDDERVAIDVLQQHGLSVRPELLGLILKGQRWPLQFHLALEVEVGE